MNVLAFDTCYGAVSAAVRSRGAAGEWLMRDRFELRQGGHAERLMPMIAEVLEDAGLAFSDLDRLAVTVGPGTFTGVRVGVAAARGLALASGLPVVGASSLAAMAHHADALLGEPRADLLAVAIDARRGMVYLQLFEAGLEAECDPVLLSPKDAVAHIGNRALVIVGSGGQAIADAMTATRPDVRLPELQPHARALALLAETLPLSTPVRPLYLRPPDVKPQAGISLGRAFPS